MKYLKFLYLLFLVVCFSCKREIPPTPGAIKGPSKFCIGSTQQYSIAPVDGSSYYLWTGPDDATIAYGQGTTTITVNFGKHAGQICVRSNNSKETSTDAACLAVTQGCNSGEWCKLTNFLGSERIEAVAFSIGNKGYIGTGRRTSVYLKDFWEYNPSTNTWTQKADLKGTERSLAVGFSIGVKGYIGTGSFADNKKDFWEYDPTGNKWTQKSDFGGTARWGAVGFSIGLKGYVGTGFDNNYKKDFWEYDPITDKWTIKTNFGGNARYSAVALSIINKGYIGTGKDSIGNFYNDFWEYDPNDISNGFDINGSPNGKWTIKTPFGGTARNSAIAISIEDKGYIGTGGIGNTVFDDFWQYDPLSDTWDIKTNFLGTARYGAVAFSIGSKGYIETGYDYIKPYENDFYQYQQ